MTRRLLLGYLAITLMVLGVLAIPLGYSLQRQELQKVTRGLVQDAFVQASKAQLSVRNGRMDPDASAAITAFAKRTNVRVVVVDRLGKALLDTDPTLEGDAAQNFADRKEFKDVLGSGVVSIGQRYSRTLGGDLVYVAVPVGDQGRVIGATRLTFATDPIDKRVRGDWLFLVATALISLGAVAVLGIVLARSIGRPIRELEHAAVAFGAGDLGRRIQTDQGPHEVRSLATAFNQTAARLQEVMASQEAFVADASHQLRTPLTGLRLRLENLEPDVAEHAREDVDAAITEVDRLARMVDGLLALARVDRGERVVAAPLEVGSFLAERIAIWQPFAEERQVALSTDAPPSLWVLADPDRLSQVVDNLVANALDAIGGRGGTIRVWGRPAPGPDEDSPLVDLHVTDNGPGMSATERTRAFDRFWRADNQRRAEFGGSGLGLAIVSKLAHADGGTVRLDQAPGGGLDAVVTLSGPALLPPPDGGERRRRALYR